ncbi:MAG: murein biosynthesis integral membrane protein MurJ [Burkholderiales bacterium]|nr:murein biosynthesis integral membrane protein MurJ [Burkholderiales bacterium]
MNLLKAVYTVSGMTLVSRVTGLVRESLKAAVFGAGPAMDAFEAAFRLPNLLRRLFAEGAFSQAFVPILADVRRTRGAAETRDLVSRVASLLAVVLVAVTAVGLVASPWLVYLLAGAFARDPSKSGLATELVRIVFPYILFISLTSLAGGVLNVHRRFAIPAFTPVLLNLAMIAATLFVAPHVDPPIVALAWGVAIGGALQLGLQIRPLVKLGMLPRPTLDWRHPDVRRVLVAMGPALLGVSAAQISILINTQLAAWLGDGRIAWIAYADRLMEFPTALLGVALGTVLLPTLARHAGDGDEARYSALLDWGLRLALLLALPAAVALWLLALPLVSTLYQYGRFGAVDALATRAALLGYAVGLAGIVAVKILAPGFYARTDLRTPVRVAFATVLVSQSLAFLLMHPLGHAGLTLATSIGALFNATVLWVLLRRSGGYTPRPGWPRFLLRVLVAAALLAAVLALGAGPASLWLNATLFERVGRLAVLVAAGAAAYFGALALLGFRVSDFSRRDAGPMPPPPLDDD